MKIRSTILVTTCAALAACGGGGGSDNVFTRTPTATTAPTPVPSQIAGITPTASPAPMLTPSPTPALTLTPPPALTPTPQPILSPTPQAGFTPITALQQQTITLSNNNPVSLLSGQSAVLAATATSTGEVSFEVAPSSNTICSVSGSTVRALNVEGDCVIIARQVGGNIAGKSYYPIARTLPTIVVSQAVRTVKFDPSLPASLNAGASQTLAATTTAGNTSEILFASSTPSICTVSGSMLRTTGVAGECVVTATQAAGSYQGASYKLASATAKILVEKATLSVAFSSTLPKTLAATDSLNLQASTSANTAVTQFVSDTPSICTVSGSTVTALTSAGSCKVTATFPGGLINGVQYGSASATYSFLVVVTQQSIRFDPIPAATLAANASMTVSAKADSMGAVTYASRTPQTCTVSGNTVKATDVEGICTVVATQAGGLINQVYWTPAEASVNVTVSKAPQSITFSTEPPAAAYATATFTVAASASSGGTVSLTSKDTNICTIGSNGQVSTKPVVGTCTIVASQAGGLINGTYWRAAPNLERTINIIQEQQTVSFTTSAPTTPVKVGTTRTLNAVAQPSNAPVSFVSQTPNTCTVNGSTVTAIAAGYCNVLAQQSGGLISNVYYAPATSASGYGFSIEP